MEADLKCPFTLEAEVGTEQRVTSNIHLARELIWLTLATILV